MARTKKSVEEEEELTTETTIADFMPEGKLVEVVDFFDRLDATVQPLNEYDVVVYRMIDRPRYYIGTAAARARDALVPGGIMIIDTYGFAGDMDEVKVIIEFEGLTFVENKDAIYKFEKIVTEEEDKEESE